MEGKTMMKIKLPIIAMLSFLLFSSFSLTRVNYNNGRFKNVCKSLKGDVLFYLIFVDSKTTSPWTEFDILSTLDSVQVASKWIEQQAQENDIPLNIKVDYFIGEQYTTITKNLPYKSVWESANEPSPAQGIKALNKWADYIAKRAGASFYITDKDGIPEVKKPDSKERLVAFLRDENNVESVVLLFMVNNYFRTDISLPINHMNTNDVEFAIVSYKYPSIISHNVFHLFGAADMYKTIYRRDESAIKILEEKYPNDIMQDVYSKGLGNIEISDYTKYLIGWKNKIDIENKKLLVDKTKKF